MRQACEMWRVLVCVPVEVCVCGRAPFEDACRPRASNHHPAVHVDALGGKAKGCATRGQARPSAVPMPILPMPFNTGPMPVTPALLFQVTEMSHASSETSPHGSILKARGM